MGAETTTPRELLLANLDRIHELVQFLARRYRMAPDEVEELEAYVRLRLIDNDFQILRTFEGRSAIGTYLQRRPREWPIAIEDVEAFDPPAPLAAAHL